LEQGLVAVLCTTLYMWTQSGGMKAWHSNHFVSIQNLRNFSKTAWTSPSTAAKACHVHVYCHWYK